MHPVVKMCKANQKHAASSMGIAINIAKQPCKMISTEAKKLHYQISYLNDIL